MLKRHNRYAIYITIAIVWSLYTAYFGDPMLLCALVGVSGVLIFNYMLNSSQSYNAARYQYQKGRNHRFVYTRVLIHILFTAVILGSAFGTWYLYYMFFPKADV